MGQEGDRNVSKNDYALGLFWRLIYFQVGRVGQGFQVKQTVQARRDKNSY